MYRVTTPSVTLRTRIFSIHASAVLTRRWRKRRYVTSDSRRRRRRCDVVLRVLVSSTSAGGCVLRFTHPAFPHRRPNTRYWLLGGREWKAGDAVDDESTAVVNQCAGHRQRRQETASRTPNTHNRCRTDSSIITCCMCSMIDHGRRGQIADFCINRGTFVVHPAWTLLKSVSNLICFLLLMIYTVSQKTSPMFLAITRESIVGFS